MLWGSVTVCPFLNCWAGGCVANVRWLGLWLRGIPKRISKKLRKCWNDGAVGFSSYRLGGVPWLAMWPRVRQSRKRLVIVAEFAWISIWLGLSSKRERVWLL